MSERALSVLSWVVPAVLAAVGAYFALIYEPRLEAGLAPVGRQGGAGEDAGAVEIVRALRREQELREARDLEPPHGEEDAPRPRDLQRLKRQGTEAERIARRFFAAFARYELGLLDPLTEARLRETVTTRFARLLLAEPPRLPAGGERPALAELGELGFAPGAAGRGAMRTAELVGWVQRTGARTPLAIELELRARGWRVSGIGR